MARGRRCHAFLSTLQGAFSPIDFNGASVRLCLCCGKELLNTASWGSLVFVSEQLLAKPLVSKWKHTFSSRQGCKPYLDLASFLFTFCCCCDSDRFANLSPWLGADFTNPSSATEAGRGGWPWSRLFPLQWDSSACSLTPANKQHSVSAQQLPCRRSVPSGSCCSSACSWQRKWHLFSVPAVSSAEVPKTKCLSSRSRSKEGFLMPDHGLACRGRERGIVSFNDGGLGGMEREWQIGRERTSNRSRGKDGRRAREKTGMAEMERKHEIWSDRASLRQGNKGKEAE